MLSDPLFYKLLLVGCLWLCFILPVAWPSERAITSPSPPKPAQPTRKRSREPNPCAGLTRTPSCATCEHTSQAPLAPPPPAPPPCIVSRRGRRRQVDTSWHCCPHPSCAYRGWVGHGNSSANGHPNGGPWRQRHGTSCGGSCQETHGTPWHGKRVPPDLLVWAVGALAEGVGIRAVARVFEVDPNTVLAWLVEVAEHVAAFSQYFLHALRVTQGQRDALFALLSAVKVGEVSEAEAIQRLSRSPHWVWGASEPVTTRLRTIEVGERTVAMAQRVVHQGVQVVAPGCVPRFLTDGLKAYATAFLTHVGQWVQPPRRQATGPLPQPRWRPLPQLR